MVSVHQALLTLLSCHNMTTMTNTIFYYPCFSQEQDLMKLPYKRESKQTQGPTKCAGDMMIIMLKEPKDPQEEHATAAVATTRHGTKRE